MTTTTEIAELKQQIADLRAHNTVLEQRLDAIAPKPAPAPPRVERGVTITHASPMAPSTNLPTEEEAEALLEQGPRGVSKNSRCSGGGR